MRRMCICNRDPDPSLTTTQSPLPIRKPTPGGLSRPHCARASFGAPLVSMRLAKQDVLGRVEPAHELLRRGALLL